MFCRHLDKSRALVSFLVGALLAVCTGRGLALDGRASRGACCVAKAREDGVRIDGVAVSMPCCQHTIRADPTDMPFVVDSSFNVYLSSLVSTVFGSSIITSKVLSNTLNS